MVWRIWIAKAQTIYMKDVTTQETSAFASAYKPDPLR